MSEFKRATPQSNVDTTTANASLPGLDIEIVHRRAPAGEAEQISINLQAVPSFEAFGRYLEAANPFAFWAEANRLAWLSWLQAAHAVMLPWNLAPSLPKPRADTRPRPEELPLPE